MSGADHWEKHAKNWRLVGAPLRPSRVDVGVFESIANNAPHNGRPLEALLLGVTVELITMKWPKETRLTAVERSQAMIEMAEKMIAGTPGAEVFAVQKSDWRNMMHIPQGGYDLVLGDGCFTTLTSDLYASVLRQIHRVLRPHGVFAHRYFLQSDPQESPDDVLTSKDTSFDSNKLRLLMSLQKSFEEGVRVHEAWEAWAQATWPTDLTAAATIEAYEGSKAIYTFPTPAELKEALKPFFHVQLVDVPQGYPLSERCPIVMCTRKDD